MANAQLLALGEDQRRYVARRAEIDFLTGNEVDRRPLVVGWKKGLNKSEAQLEAIIERPTGSALPFRSYSP